MPKAHFEEVIIIGQAWSVIDAVNLECFNKSPKLNYVCFMLLVVSINLNENNMLHN